MGVCTWVCVCVCVPNRQCVLVWMIVYVWKVAF